MPRLLFEKKGKAVWISHLDLMRLFQRAFKRAELLLTHTHGFNPRPSVSIALPLSVGVESCCELLDFDLDGEPVSNADIRQRLNDCLVDGIRVLDVYNSGEKIRELAYLDCLLEFTYDREIDAQAVSQMQGLFDGESLFVEKKTKSGIQEQDIIPMIRSLDVKQTGPCDLELYARICCQNPSLNPNQLVSAIEKFLPTYRPDGIHCCRMEIYNKQESVFR